jgi:hypothetical protein
MLSLKKICAALLVLTSAVLLAIWPLPNTMAVRNLMLLIGFCSAIVVIWQSAGRIGNLNAWPIYILFSSFVWVILHYVLLAGDPDDQWHELTGDWVRNFLAAVIGLALGLVVSGPQADIPKLVHRYEKDILAVGLSATVFIFCLRYGYEVIQTGTLKHHNFYMMPYLGKTPLVVFGGIFLPLMFMKVLAAIHDGGKPSMYFWSFCGISASLMTFYFSNTKNGLAVFVLLLAYFLIKVCANSHKFETRRKQFYVLLTVMVLTVGYVAKKHADINPAWSNLIADYKIGVQIDEHTNWKDNVSPLPINENGNVAHASTYSRTAWARAGLELAKENPLGYGLINHSFGAMALNKWPDFHQPDGKNRGSTHSGWIDLTLAFGLPGLTLILLPLLSAYVRARKSVEHWSVYAMWVIPVIVLTYLTTEVCTGHFIELLFFMTAFFSGFHLKQASSRTAADAG